VVVLFLVLVVVCCVVLGLLVVLFWFLVVVLEWCGCWGMVLGVWGWLGCFGVGGVVGLWGVGWLGWLSWWLGGLGLRLLLCCWCWGAWVGWWLFGCLWCFVWGWVLVGVAGGGIVWLVGCWLVVVVVVVLCVGLGVVSVFGGVLALWVGGLVLGVVCGRGVVVWGLRGG
ncbi:hypothetical protein, partial [Pseudomonas syringae group genomosp. 7]|uniref:hypothetical protein n=1 Tax=Pseudomonas syringae group genomosp. 7 TaxID=251699 RepID=UPI00377004B9